MRIFKDNWLVLLLLGALVASPIYSHADASRQASQQSDALRKTNITRCITTTPRAAYEIAFQYQAGEIRRAAGNIVTAEKYAALADAGVNTVPVPDGVSGRKAAVEIVYTRGSDGTMKATLTPNAKKLQKLGCQEAFRKR